MKVLFLPLKSTQCRYSQQYHNSCLVSCYIVIVNTYLHIMDVCNYVSIYYDYLFITYKIYSKYLYCKFIHMTYMILHNVKDNTYLIVMYRYLLEFLYYIICIYICNYNEFQNITSHLNILYLHVVLIIKFYLFDLRTRVSLIFESKYKRLPILNPNTEISFNFCAGHVLKLHKNIYLTSQLAVHNMTAIATQLHCIYERSSTYNITRGYRCYLFIRNGCKQILLIIIINFNLECFILIINDL